MTLADFRKSRRVVTLAEAESEMSFLTDIDLAADYTHVCIYDRDAYILQSRRNFYLVLEGDEYESRDLALLEFVLWQWAAEETHELVALRALIWG